MKPSKEAMKRVMDTMLGDKFLKRKLESTGVFMEIIEEMARDIEGFQEVREDYDRYLRR